MDESIKHTLAAHAKWVSGDGGVRANLTGANLNRANLEGANLDGASLIRANLTGAILTGAILDCASLIRANLTGANLEGANLTGANLEGANLDGASLIRANLTGADLHCAYFAHATVIDGGQRRDGYRFVAIRHDAGPMIAAGCHWFDMSSARTHWSDPRYRDRALGDENLAILDHIDRVARLRGWPMGA